MVIMLQQLLLLLKAEKLTGSAVSEALSTNRDSDTASRGVTLVHK